MVTILVVILCFFITQPLYTFTLDNMVMVQQYNMSLSNTAVTLNQNEEIDINSEVFDSTIMGTNNRYKAIPKTDKSQSNEDFVSDQLHKVRQQYHSIQY